MSDGRFVKGISGNPNGRPTIPKEIRELLDLHTVDAVKALIACLHHEDSQVVIKAATAILDRRFGKPAQSIAVSGDESSPLRIAIEVQYLNDDWKQQPAHVYEPTKLEIIECLPKLDA